MERGERKRKRSERERECIGGDEEGGWRRGVIWEMKGGVLWEFKMGLYV